MSTVLLEEESLRVPTGRIFSKRSIFHEENSVENSWIPGAVRSRVRGCLELVKELINTDPYVLDQATDEIKNDYSIAQFILEMYSGYYSSLGSKTRSDLDLAVCFCRKDGMNWEFVELPAKKNLGLIGVSLRQNLRLLGVVPAVWLGEDVVNRLFPDVLEKFTAWYRGNDWDVVGWDRIIKTDSIGYIMRGYLRKQGGRR